MPHLVLARHGLSTWNLEGRIQGQHNCPLTDVGRNQANQLGNLLTTRNLRFVQVHSSGLVRADETARIVLRAMGMHAPILIYPEIAERHWGSLQGMKGDDIRGMRDRLLDWESVPPGGESFAQVAERTASYLRTITPLLQQGMSILSVCHSGSLATLQCHIERLVWNSPGIGTPNAGARMYTFSDGTFALEEVIRAS